MKFKKIVLGMLIAALAIGAIACSKSDSNTGNQQQQQQEQGKKELSGSLEEIMASIYEGLNGIEMPDVGNIELTDENVANFAGIESLDGAEGLASEALMRSKAHSVVLIKAQAGTDIEALKADIKEKVNPMKWICVGVERDQVIVDNIGNTVIMIIDDNVADKIHESFLALAK